MKIGINAINFIGGKVGGVETYLKNLWRFLQSADTGNRYSLLCASRYAEEFPVTNPAFTVEGCNYQKPSFNWLMRGVARNTIGMDILRGAIDRYKFDVVHYPLTVLSPRGVKAPTVVTFWDMQHEFYPEFFSAAELAERKVRYKPSAEEATRVIVSSGFTKTCLVERYGIHDDKIDVVYTGFGPEYRMIDDEEALNGIRAAYGLDRPFVYYPAATWPHKNHKALLAAFKLLRDRKRFDGELVFTGIAMGAQEGMMAEIARLGLTGSVRVLGYLPGGDLPYLYNLARVMAFPSLFEGFGIPLVEAMACGCPIACSNATSLPEVAGNAAILFDPASPEDIADKIGEVWEDDTLRERMIADGLERVKVFDWTTTARKTLDVYRKAATSW